MAAAAVANSLEPQQLLSDLLWLAKECEERCMVDGAKWASEILCYLPSSTISVGEQNAEGFAEIYAPVPVKSPVADRFGILAKSLLLTKDYHRALLFFDKARKLNDRYTFLYYWTRYLKIVNEDMENGVESIERKASDVDDDKEMAGLYCELVKYVYEPNNGDCFFYYLLGCVQRILGMRETAKEMFILSIQTDCRFFPAWEELSTMMEDLDDVDRTKNLAASHWMGDWFEALAIPKFLQYMNAVTRTDELASRGLGQQPALMAHAARCCNLSNDHDAAIDLFKQVATLAPARIEEMHLYSDSLFVRQDRVALSSLAHGFFLTHKFDWRTCLVVANYYSIRGEKDQSVRFLQRASALNPNESSIWIIIGHEFMEMKNHAAGCMAYRKAIEIDPLDKRAWYGLGQLYDILKMHSYALFYYQEAHRCSPNDSRFLVALGEVYQKLNRNIDAERCFLKAFKVGDLEGQALIRLAHHYEGLNMKEAAAAVYETYLEEYKSMEKTDSAVPSTLLFLTRYYETIDLEKAHSYALRCMTHEQSRHEGSTLMTQIQVQRQRKATLRSASTPRRRMTLDLTNEPSATEEGGGEEAMAVVSDGEEDISFE